LPSLWSMDSGQPDNQHTGCRSIMIQSFDPSVKRLLGGLVLAVALLHADAGHAGAPQDAIVGTWLTEDGGSKVDIAASTRADGTTVYSGRVSWLKDPTRDGKPLRDAKNDDAARRDRPILGLEIVSGFKAAAGGWGGGSLYSPRNGRSYPAELSLTPDGRLEVKVKAGFVSKTVYWSR